MRGRTDDFRITLVELVPSHYLLLDGAHRVCAWKILCEANPELIQDCAAQILSSTLTWQQVAIICGAKNDMPTKQHDLLDTVSDSFFCVISKETYLDFFFLFGNSFFGFNNFTSKFLKSSK